MRSVLVTGGTGSLGRAVIQRALKDGADRVVCFARDEFKEAMLFHALGAFIADPAPGDLPALRCFLGDIRDRARLERAMRGVECVVHTAALKWVGDGVYNPDEIVKTNVLGTMNVIDAAAAAGVEKVLVITSDKGCHAANVYGASKFLAESYAVAANAFTFPQGTKVAAIRFGNLLWSRGSVAHRFQDSLFAARPPVLRITDKRMTRFGITLSRAVDLIGWALENLRGGEIFVPRLPSFRLTELAAAFWYRFHRAADPLPLEEVGLRKGGEKLHEMLLTPEEGRRAVWHDPAKLYVVEPEIRSWHRDAWEGSGGAAAMTSDQNTEWLDAAALRETFPEMDKGLASA